MVEKRNHFDDNYDWIRFDETVYCLLASDWTRLHHYNMTMVMLIRQRQQQWQHVAWKIF